jgi:hypothetical protein
MRAYGSGRPAGLWLPMMRWFDGVSIKQLSAHLRLR